MIHRLETPLAEVSKQPVRRLQAGEENVRAPVAIDVAQRHPAAIEPDLVTGGAAVGKAVREHQPGGRRVKARESDTAGGRDVQGKEGGATVP